LLRHGAIGATNLINIGSTLAAVGERLRTMLQAVKTVHSALDSFYGKLDDEQKAQFETFGSAAGEPG
jgi:hypothetical protein